MGRIRHFGIVVSDIEKSLYFYRDLLGLKIERDMIEEGEFIDTILGMKNIRVRTVKMAIGDGSLLELLWYESYRRKAREDKDFFRIGVSHVAFTVEDVDSEYERLKKSGISFNCPPQISPDRKAKVTFCYDPDGVPVELVEELTN